MAKRKRFFKHVWHPGENLVLLKRIAEKLGENEKLALAFRNLDVEII